MAGSRYNWYNFGFITVTMDTLFRTVKHPRDDALATVHSSALHSTSLPFTPEVREAFVIS